MSREFPNNAPSIPSFTKEEERENEIRSLLANWSDPGAEHLPRFDQVAFNKGIFALYKAMSEGRFYERVAQATTEAYEQMGLTECLATSPTAQLFCATIYAITQPGVEANPLLRAAQAISQSKEGSEREEARDTFYRLFSDSFLSAKPFHAGWVDQGIAWLREIGEHNEKHPNALEYFIPVSYEPMPSVAELEKEFGKRNVSSDLDDAEFIKHPSCEGVDETSGIRIVCLRQFDQAIESEEAIREMGRIQEEDGTDVFYHPGTEKELLAFSRAYSDFQRKRPVSALGSEASVGGFRRGACLWSLRGGRYLYVLWFVDKWGDDFQFLAVRE